MRVLLDACVLYPTVLREILMGMAEAGLLTPLWSDRILEEWARAAARTEVEDIARSEIALLRHRWPDSLVSDFEGREAGLSLPDENDVHVLAAALHGLADILVTLNLRDFPHRTLAQYALVVNHPDTFLMNLLHASPETVTPVLETVRQRTEILSGRPQPLRPLLKRARLPRLGKAMSDRVT